MLKVFRQITEKCGAPIQQAAQPMQQDIGAKGQPQNRVCNDHVGSLTAGNSFQAVHRADGLTHKSSSKFLFRSRDATGFIPQAPGLQASSSAATLYPEPQRGAACA